MQPQYEYDVIILGAGVSGLACAAQLILEGRKVLVLEAADRVGGRVLTHFSGANSIGVELGAEFLHGKTPLTDHWLANAKRVPLGEKHQSWRAGNQLKNEGIWEQVETLFSKLQVRRTNDRSFAEFLEATPASQDTRDFAISYVEGFNAAEASIISETNLALWNDDEGEMQEGSRLPGGYKQLIDALTSAVGRENILTNEPVDSVHWKQGSVEVGTSNQRYKSKQLICTVSVGVLNSGRLAFHPEIQGMKEVLSKVVMGHADRLSLEFRSAFWKSKTGDADFLHFSGTKTYPVWWQSGATLLTAWAGGTQAKKISSLTLEERINGALTDLAHAMGFDRAVVQEEFLRAHHHDWTHDSRTFGAYSYVAKDGVQAAEHFIQDSMNTVYFAGEAACDGIHRGTVEGALMSARNTLRRMSRT